MYYFTVYCFFTYFVRNAYPVRPAEIATYEGAQVWQTKLRGNKDILTIKKLIADQDISIWKLETNQADFLIKPDKKAKVNRILKSMKLNHSVVIMDVQRRVDELRVEPSMWNEDTLRLGHRLNWREYPNLRVIDEYLVYLTDNFPAICKLTTIGYTEENRAIRMLTISNGNPENKAILITAGQHAREWIAVTSALYVIDKIIAKFDQLPRYMKTIDWMIIPVLNPDGYEYSHTHDRLWRKNRRKINNCHGVDINRNFNIDWDVVGVTNKDECSDAYAGPHAFSEAESKALREMIASSNKKPSAMLDFHSYGQLILYPWGANPFPTADRRMLWTTSKAMAEAIYNTTKSHYEFGSTYRMMYSDSGTNIDWMYSSGVTRSFAIEVRDEGFHGFLLSPDNIEPTGKEMLAAVRQLAREIHPEMLRLKGWYEWFLSVIEFLSDCYFGFHSDAGKGEVFV